MSPLRGNLSLPRCSPGFTLIEVMVALLIVSVALSALLLRINSFVDSTAYLRDKTIAHWVATNQLERARLTNQHSNRLLSDELSGEEEMAGQRWIWRIKPIKTEAEGVQQLQVSVYPRGENDRSSENATPLVILRGFADEYHKL